MLRHLQLGRRFVYGVPFVNQKAEMCNNVYRVLSSLAFQRVSMLKNQISLLQAITLKARSFLAAQVRPDP